MGGPFFNFSVVPFIIALVAHMLVGGLLLERLTRGADSSPRPGRALFVVCAVMFVAGLIGGALDQPGTRSVMPIALPVLYGGAWLGAAAIVHRPPPLRAIAAAVAAAVTASAAGSVTLFVALQLW